MDARFECLFPGLPARTDRRETAIYRAEPTTVGCQVRFRLLV
jgi:hypothetical protein